MALPPFLSNKKRPSETPYWRAGFRSSAPGGSGPNGNRITLVFLYTFHGFHEARIGTGVFTDSLFSLLIIALLDLGGIRFLLSCCVLHFLGFLSLNVLW